MNLESVSLLAMSILTLVASIAVLRLTLHDRDQRDRDQQAKP